MWYFEISVARGGELRVTLQAWQPSEPDLGNTSVGKRHRPNSPYRSILDRVGPTGFWPPPFGECGTVLFDHFYTPSPFPV
jgi:hypothetical protein